jgi:hypothetical protein
MPSATYLQWGDQLQGSSSGGAPSSERWCAYAFQYFRPSPEEVRSFMREASIEGKMSYVDLASHAADLWASTAATTKTVSIYCSNAPIVGKPHPEHLTWGREGRKQPYSDSYLSALKTHTYMPIFVEGITSKAFYMGPAITKSPVHDEDLAGCSINVNHLGDPKLWIVIPPNQQEKLLDKGEDNVKNFYNKHIFIPPSTLDRWDIGYYTGFQRKGYTVLTFSAHQVSHNVVYSLGLDIHVLLLCGTRVRVQGFRAQILQGFIVRVTSCNLLSTF